MDAVARILDTAGVEDAVTQVTGELADLSDDRHNVEGSKIHVFYT